MEFWGVEVKSGETLVVEPGHEMVLHLSQACLGEFKKDKGNDPVFLYVNIGGQKLVLGTLSADKFPQISFDLVFEKEFVLSHNWKNGSVYFSGYRSLNPAESDASDYDDLGEDFPLQAANNVGKPVTQAKQGKPAVENATSSKADSAAPKHVKIVEPNKDGKPNGMDDDSEDGSEDDDSESGPESDDDDEVMPMPNADAESEDEESDEDDESEDDESDDEDEAAAKAAPIRKRPADSATKTPVSDKKAKLETPQKTDGKKGVVHVATPHPSKQAGKTPAVDGKSKQQTPKSGGAFSCKSCDRSFGSDKALEAHTKAKHVASK